MKNLTQYFFLVALLSYSCSAPQQKEKVPFEGGIYHPAKELGIVFHEIQMQQVFPDGKTFVDYTPKYRIKDIVDSYQPGTDIQLFVESNFSRFPDLNLPAINTENLSLEKHLPNHWTYLTRPPDTSAIQGSLLPLPNPYVVPGGRFREIYYWDSYFTMLGLAESGRIDLVKDMIENFAYLIDTYGHIPNGNRSYYLSRSQPPYFSSMVMLLANLEGVDTAVKYLPQLVKEYQFWMKGKPNLEGQEISALRTVKIGGGVLNRYWDDLAEPRPESYREDYELAEETSEQSKESIYRNLKAGAESGWDYSSRWFSDRQTLASIMTTEIIPVDLNCLLYHLESTISQLYEAKQNSSEAERYGKLAEKRKQLINQVLWNEAEGFYTDYDLSVQKKSDFLTAAVATPLFFQIASAEQAKKVSEVIEKQLLLPGGLVTTLSDTGQQWDYPNGWAPLQWIAVEGLSRYGYDLLAKKIASRWVSLNRKVFSETGKMMEKYNVANIDTDAGGGEYPLQDGFGWTNGIALKLLSKFEGL